MAVFSNFGAIGNSLAAQLPGEMFLHQDGDTNNLLEFLAPKELEYFGVKSYNIFVAQKPYGWVKQGNGKYLFNWPDSGMITSLNNLINSHADYFTSYKTRIYVDMYNANRVQQEHPSCDIVNMMTTTSAKIQEMCTQNPELFEFGGNLDTAAEASNFLQKYKDFYGSPAYKKPTV